MAKDDEPKKPETSKEKGKGTFSKSTSTPPKAGQPKKYDDVITKDAKTQPGVFAVHRIDDRVYFEIPADKLNKLMMFRAEVARGSGGSSFNGTALGTKFIRFERRENKIYVIEANPNPWLASAAEFALAARESGRSYPDLVREITEMALARYA